MPLIEIEQRMADGSANPEWLQMRLGAVTASRVADVMARLKTKNGEAAVRAAYKAELVCERLTGRAAEHYVSPAMEWGIENETDAKTAYEIETGFDVAPGGIAIHPKIKWLLASPDGLIGEDGLLEAKCPNTTTHIEYILAGIVPAEYQPQMLCQMACTERKFCDFVSFDPRLPKELQLFIRRLERDEAQIATMEAEVIKFSAEVDEVIKKLGKSTLIDLDPTYETKLRESIDARKAAQ